MDRIKKINPSLNSGCLNEEISKKELPDEISYSTCSGFSNHLGVGIREDDSLGPEKGINKYVTTGYYHGIQRKWLTHYQTTNLDRIAKTKDVIKKMDVNEVYGAIVHAGKSEHEAFITFLEFIHQQDPAGEQSRTLTEVIKQKLLPEKSISTDLLDKEEDKNNNYLCKCGDEICDDFEQRNPLLCPKDCRQSDVQPSNSK